MSWSPDDITVRRRYNRAVPGADSSHTWRVEVGSEATAVAWDPVPGSEAGIVFVCAHGAGGHMGDRSMLAIRDELRSRNVATVRFDFLYRTRRSARPDPMPRLLACYAAVVERVRAEIQPRTLLLGGRSMGGRTASMLAADGAECDGLLLLAYPLHPPGQPAKMRDAHLPAIRVPVLCVNGTRDTFCDRALMETVLARLGANWRMHWLDGADHGFHVPKSSGRTDRDVMTETGEAVDDWIATNRLAGAC
jgi:predicted alpha/beta-hydrolase family hydrolase